MKAETPRPPLQPAIGAIHSLGYPTGVPGRDGWVKKNNWIPTVSQSDGYLQYPGSTSHFVLLSQNVILVEHLEFSKQ